MKGGSSYKICISTQPIAGIDNLFLLCVILWGTWSVITGVQSVGRILRGRQDYGQADIIMSPTVISTLSFQDKFTREDVPSCCRGPSVVNLQNSACLRKSLERGTEINSPKTCLERGAGFVPCSLCDTKKYVFGCRKLMSDYEASGNNSDGESADSEFDDGISSGNEDEADKADKIEGEFDDDTFDLDPDLLNSEHTALVAKRKASSMSSSMLMSAYHEQNYRNLASDAIARSNSLHSSGHCAFCNENDCLSRSEKSRLRCLHMPYLDDQDNTCFRCGVTKHKVKDCQLFMFQDYMSHLCTRCMFPSCKAFKMRSTVLSMEAQMHICGNSKIQRDRINIVLFMFFRDKQQNASFRSYLRTNFDSDLDFPECYSDTSTKEDGKRSMN